jgi:predicted RNA-binding Zn-ribbon protein involved in translation (DUF1610 family)
VNFQQSQLRLEDVNAATARAKDRILRLQVQLEMLTLDPDRDDRRAAQACVVCYYGSRIGGAAMTEANCRVCNTEMQFGSTAVDAVCPTCARTLQLCRQCGGDREMHLRRKLNVKGIEPVTPFPEPRTPASWVSPVLLPVRSKPPEECRCGHDRLAHADPSEGLNNQCLGCTCQGFDPRV